MSDSVVYGRDLNAASVGATTPDTGKFTTLEATGAVIFNEAGADVDFRVESTNNTHAILVDASGDVVGIFNSDPGQLNSSANALVIGDGVGSRGVTVFAGTGSTGNLFFADGITGNDEFRGFVQYSHVANTLSLGTNGVEAINISAGGIVKLTKATGAMQVNSLTTTERDALTPVNGMIIYNETTNQMEGYINGAWAAM